MFYRLSGRPLVHLVAGVALLASACGGEDDAVPPSGTDTGLTDIGGPDGGADAVLDSGPDLPPEGEDLFIAYTQESTFDDSMPVQLFVVDSDCRAPNADLCDPGTCAPVQVMPRNASEPLCNVGCRLTSDLSHVVFLDPDEPRTLRSAPLDDGFQLSADSTVIASDVSNYLVQDQTVVYRVENDLHVVDLASGSDVVVAGFLNSNGGFHLSDDASTLFVNDVVSLTAMDVSMVDLASQTVIPVFHFVSGEEQGTGSFFSGREPMALSPDGTRLAVVTNARTSGSVCNSNADCTEAGATCLTSATPPRCVRQELSLNIVNLTATDRLRTACSSDPDCGDDHFCDLTAIDVNGQGECLPGRFSLGPSGPTACQHLSLGQYSGARGDLDWRSDRTVLGVFTQDCIRGNIPVTDLVALNLDGAAFERLTENQAADHGGCFNDVENCFDVGSCNVEIDTTAVSPSGQTVALVADSVSTSLKAELWLIDAFGRSEKELLTRSIDWEIRSVSLHSLE